MTRPFRAGSGHPKAGAGCIMLRPLCFLCAFWYNRVNVDDLSPPSLCQGGVDYESIPFLVEICGSGLVLNLYVARKPQFLLQGLSQCR